ncbi:MAG: CaiB/BaiF CoA transferase family protein [Coriobacteriales bacterium]
MKPLEGIKVVDLTSYLAAPTTGRVLAEWGAEVVKVESFSGDPARRQAGVFNMPMSDDENLAFDFANFGKQFVTLNLKSETGLEVMMKLLAEADVFLTSNRTKSLTKMGLDYPTLHEKFPGLVYAQVTGYGDKGAEKDAAGFDVTCYMARGGVFGTTVNRGDAPLIPTNGLGDFGVSLFLAAGISAALYKRTVTGEGDRVSVPLQHAGLYTLSTGIISAQYGNEYPKNRCEVPNPFNNMYCCSDGKWVCVCLPEYDRDFTKMCNALQIDPQEFLSIDPEINICAKVNEKKLNTQVVAILDSHFKNFTQAQILETFKANDMPCEPASTPLNIYEDQNCWDNDMLVKIPYPSGDRIMATCPIHFDSMPGAPEYVNYGNMGAQTESIMAKLGYTAEQIAAAEERGDVRGDTSIFA